MKNVLSHKNGARVVYASGHLYPDHPIYSADTIDGGRSVDNGGTFWKYMNSWVVQGIVNNSDEKDLVYDAYGASKSVTNATTMLKTLGDLRVILDPFARDPLNRKVIRANEIFLAAANSDGDIGDFEIFMTKDLGAMYDPLHPSWRSVKKGFVGNVGVLNNYAFDRYEEFNLLMLRASANKLSYVEVMAIKAYDIPNNTRYLIRQSGEIKSFEQGKGWLVVDGVPI